MIVIGIVAIVMSIGVPSVFRSLQKDALRKAVNELVEGCSHARAQAILQGVPSEFVLRENGQMTVQKVPTRGSAAPRPTPIETSATGENATAPRPAVFNAQLDDNIAVEFIWLNFKDQMAEAETHVRFFPNGTSDEFTVILSSVHGAYRISLDIITGLAGAEKIK